MTSLRDRVLGCVLGLALGGAPDATAMARNLVRSLGERGRLDPDDLMEHHVAWFRSGPQDVGTVTRLVLARVERGESARDAARAVWEERGPEVSAGNGSVVYCAPLGAAYARRPVQLSDLAPLLSSLSHHDERCRTACLAITLVTAALVRGEEAERSLHEAVTFLLDRELQGAEELEFLIEAAGTTRRIDGPDRGFCMFTAGAALRVAVTAPSFEEGIREVISYGGDANRNAAVAGALLGARDGIAELPARWKNRLVDWREIEHTTAGLLELASAGG